MCMRHAPHRQPAPNPPRRPDHRPNHFARSDPSPRDRQRTDREHLVIAYAVDVGQDEHALMAQLREPPPNAVMAAVRAIEPDEPQRVKTHLSVKPSEHTFEIALVERIYPARHDRLRRRRGRDPRRANASLAVLDRPRLAFGVIVNPQRRIKMDHPSATGNRIGHANDLSAIHYETPRPWRPA